MTKAKRTRAKRNIPTFYCRPNRGGGGKTRRAPIFSSFACYRRRSWRQGVSRNFDKNSAISQAENRAKLIENKIKHQHFGLLSTIAASHDDDHDASKRRSARDRVSRKTLPLHTNRRLANEIFALQICNRGPNCVANYRRQSFGSSRQNCSRLRLFHENVFCYSKRRLKEEAG